MEINQLLVLQLRTAIKKTNSHINSGFYSQDNSPIENVFINFLKKEVTKESLTKLEPDKWGHKECLINQLRYIKPCNTAIFANANNCISQIVFFPLKGRVAGRDLMELLETHLEQIDMKTLEDTYDTSSFSRGLTNLINKIENFSFTN